MTAWREMWLREGPPDDDTLIKWETHVQVHREPATVLDKLLDESVSESVIRYRLDKPRVVVFSDLKRVPARWRVYARPQGDSFLWGPENHESIVVGEGVAIFVPAVMAANPALTIEHTPLLKDRRQLASWMGATPLRPFEVDALDDAQVDARTRRERVVAEATLGVQRWASLKAAQALSEGRLVKALPKLTKRLADLRAELDAADMDSRHRETVKYIERKWNSIVSGQYVPNANLMGPPLDPGKAQPYDLAGTIELSLMLPIRELAQRQGLGWLEASSRMLRMAYAIEDAAGVKRTACPLPAYQSFSKDA